MAIKGTLIIEDSTIHFSVVDNNEVIYTVGDSLNGMQETKQCDGESFMIALGIALSFNGDVPSDPAAAYEKAESIQPENLALRFIP